MNTYEQSTFVYVVPEKGEEANEHVTRIHISLYEIENEMYITSLRSMVSKLGSAHRNDA